MLAPAQATDNSPPALSGKQHLPECGGPQLLAWCGAFLILPCMGYSQFRKFITREFVEALPEPLQEPSREVGRLLNTYPSLHIDQPQKWGKRQLAQFKLLADQLEKFLDEFPNHVDMLYKGLTDPWTLGLDSLPVAFKGVLYMFQVQWDIEDQKINEDYGRWSFHVIERTLDEWWGVKAARSRFGVLNQRLFAIDCCSDVINSRLVVATLGAKGSFWKAIYGVYTLSSVFGSGKKLLADIESMPATLFTPIEQDMLKIIGDLAPSLAEFRASLFRALPSASEPGEGLSREDVLKELAAINTVCDPIWAFWLMRPLWSRREASASQVGFVGDNPTKRQVRFGILMTRSLLLYYNGALEMLVVGFELSAQLVWKNQRQFSAQGPLLGDLAFDEMALEEAYAGTTREHTVIKDKLMQGLAEDPKSLEESLASFIEFSNVFDAQLRFIFFHAIQAHDLYDTLKEPEPEARGLLARTHSIAVGILRQRDDLFRIALSMEEEHRRNEWLLWLLFDVGIKWSGPVAAMRVLVPSFEAKLGIPQEDTYKWNESPLSVYLSCIRSSK